MLTALVIAVPEAAEAVEGWLEKTVLNKPSNGVPAHVTILFPFVPAEELDDETLAALRELCAGVEPFDFQLPGCARFPAVLYLAPEPAGPFRALTEAVVARWPEQLPYEGEFEEVVPHLTVAEGEDALLDAAEADVAPKLPIAARATEVVLLEQTEPLLQSWRVRERFALG